MSQASLLASKRAMVVSAVLFLASAGCQSDQANLGRVLEKLHVGMTVHDLDLMMESEGAILTRVKGTGAVSQDRYYRVGEKVVVVWVFLDGICMDLHGNVVGSEGGVESWRTANESIDRASLPDANSHPLRSVDLQEVEDRMNR